MPSATWRVALASAIGSSHLVSGTPCQDYAACRLLESDEGPVLVAVVSDGAGSAARAEVGSRTASLELINQILSWLLSGGQLSSLTRKIVENWIESVVQALETQAEADGEELREYACTLLAALMGDAAAAFLQVGDGAIVVSDGEVDHWSYIFWPQHGEFANTTNFIVSTDIKDVLEFDLALRRIDEVALFTDGLENLVLHHASRSVYEPFFNQMFKAVRASASEGLDDGLSNSLRRYLSQRAICERTDDDKSLVLATRATLSACEPQVPECPTS